MSLALKQITFAIALGLTAHSTHAAAVTEQRTVAAFRAIELSGPYRVLIKAQGRQALELAGESEELAKVETFVRGDTLVVRPVPTKGFHFGITRRRDVTIHITAAMLASLTTGGSGDVDIEQVGGEQFSVSATGPGDLRASGGVRDLTVASRGSGAVDLHQLSATNVRLAMSGPGDVSLARIGGELAADMSGSGDLDAKGLQAASARIAMTGPGAAKLAGTVGTLNAGLSGSGELDAHRLNVRNATVRSRGPGSVQLATVADTLDADLRGSGEMSATLAGKRLLLKMSGPGDARFDGSVDAVTAQLTGSGSLDGHALTAARADVVVRGPGSAVVGVQSKGADRARLLTFERGATHVAAE
ncbi:MAG: hypothetical protein JWQ01_1901 [Massilia sp.]|nr:hypothetical protein [Massilia sp.]